jgi:REP-associated tyrosine transposase
MAKDHYAEIYLHLTWHTIEDTPLIAPEMEPKLHDFIKGQCKELGALPIEIGGTAAHVHLLCSIAPNVLISDLVGRLKGSSTHFVNHRLRPRQRFAWQKGYGCVSFAKRNLAALRRYVREQKQHHAKGTTRDTLERFWRKAEGGDR